MSLSIRTPNQVNCWCRLWNTCRTRNRQNTLQRSCSQKHRCRCRMSWIVARCGTTLHLPHPQSIHWSIICIYPRHFQLRTSNNLHRPKSHRWVADRIERSSFQATTGASFPNQSNIVNWDLQTVVGTGSRIGWRSTSSIQRCRSSWSTCELKWTNNGSVNEPCLLHDT